MRGLTGLAWRSLSARRGRAVLTIVGIALGVGVLFAALATNDGIERSADRTVAALVGRADLRVTAFTERGLSDATVAAIRATPGVAVAAPRIERRTFIATALGVGPAVAPPITVLAIDPASDPRIHDLAGSAALGAAAAGAPRALVSARLAAEAGLQIGSTFTLQGIADPSVSTVTVTGILSGSGPVLGSSGRTAVITIDEARIVFGPLGTTEVDLLLAPGATVDGVTAALGQRLVNEPYVVSSPADIAASIRAATSDFQSTTALLAAVALFVSAFLIFNTLSMTVAERAREVGLLRAAGAGRGQVARFVLLQALALGIGGSIVGVGVGLVFAAIMARYVASIASVPLDGLSVPPSGIALAVGVGLAVTIAAAIEPAIRAGRISPIEALRARSAEARTGGGARLRWLVVVFIVVAVAGLLVWPTGGAVGSPLRALVVYAILLAVTIASPFLLAPLGRIAGLPFALVLRTEERLARGAAIRDRSRTALTVGALLVGVAMIVAVGAVALNARSAAESWLTDVVPGDEVVTSIVPAAIDATGPGATLGAVPGVVRVTPIATFAAAYEGIRLDATAMAGADLLADGRLTFVAGDRTAALTGLDGGGTVILPRSVADRFGLRVGDRMAFTVGGAEPVADLRVTGVVERTIPGRAGESILIGWSDAIGRFGVLGADSFAVRFAPGTAATTRPALEAAARQLALEPNTLASIRGAIGDALGQVFGLFDGLSAIAVIVAGLGIVNTLTMNVVERVREIGVLRATGMTRRQVWRMVVVEAGVLGIVGAILGSIAGMAAGAALIVLAEGSVGSVAIDVPWQTIGLAAVFGVAVAMIAAYYPARLASRISIVRAVQYE
ncbi:MAG: ABC transporter permease [Candidatus Limnocylindrales bacterium]